MKRIEIVVHKDGKFVFAIGRLCSKLDMLGPDLAAFVRDLKAKFPASEGYGVDVIQHVTYGQGIDSDKIDG